MSSSRLAGHLTAQGAISMEEYLQFEEIAVREGKPVLSVLVAKGAISVRQGHEALAYGRGWTFAPLDDVHGIAPELIDLIDPPTGRDMLVLPLRLEDNVLTVATVNPSDITARAKLHGITGHTVNFVYTPKDELQKAVTHYYSIDVEMAKKGAKATEALASEQRRLAISTTVGADEGEIVDLLNTIIEGGIAAGASDIHLEPGSTGLDIRYEIDGVEHRQRQKPKLELAARIAALIKTRAEMQSSTLFPQNGAIRHFFESQNRYYDLRVAVLPSIWGESITMRVASDKIRELSTVHFSPGIGEAWQRAIHQPNGVVMCVGPMGSGKTSLLMGSVLELRAMGKKMISLEDPVEVRLPWGMTQVPVRPGRGLEWDAAMPTVLRSAGKVLMMGEINQEAVAQETMKAAQTGHLVLTTLHTNDAPGSLIRLQELGIKNSILADTMRAVCAQRLPRMLCQHCKVQAPPTSDQIMDFRLTSEDLAATDPETGRSVWFGPSQNGCRQCGGLSYSGRLPIHELMVFNRDVRNLILEGATLPRITAAAREAGMSTLQEDGVLKVKAGLTSLTELRRHIVID
ncbi:GspE/PulE family protein [Pseudarthrobacter sp. BIM B-2242]|uniref:GspE/PulE family protein n=1 Tax=Pseudarthrobacter sp. BIM B-2242 TaxID=2772401 RepID=UPI001CC568DF|nr:ATPase, T2SS/T4P/T4SS family [Pseudarthrobacter sp. BIM B-2242]